MHCYCRDNAYNFDKLFSCLRQSVSLSNISVIDICTYVYNDYVITAININTINYTVFIYIKLCLL